MTISIFENQMMLEKCRTIANQFEQGKLTWQAARDRITTENLTPSGISPSRFAAMIVSAPNFIGTWANIPADELIDLFTR